MTTGGMPVYLNLYRIFTTLDGDQGDRNESSSEEVSPTVIQCKVKSNHFQGIEYDPEKINQDSFGAYDEDIKKLDLTDPVKSNPYFQLSFTSIKTFMKCPIRFYLNTILRLKEETYVTDYNDEEYFEDSTLTENDEEEYDSNDALFIGNLIHRYLEKHKFGDPFDLSLFEYVNNRVKSGGL